MTDQSELLGRLEAFAQNTKDAHSRIEKCLYGNGQPGLLDRMTRIEESIEKVTEQNKTNAEAIEKLSQDISKLNESVKLHQEDKTLHSLWGLSTKKQVIVWIMIAFVVFHSVISLFPDITVLLKWLLKLIGVPI